MPASSSSREATSDTAAPGLAYVVRALAGMTALAAVFLAPRWRRRTAARILLALSAVALLVTLVSFNDFGARALLTLLLPAVLLLAAASAVGPMPITPTSDNPTPRV